MQVAVKRIPNFDKFVSISAETYIHKDAGQNFDTIFQAFFARFVLQLWYNYSDILFAFWL